MGREGRGVAFKDIQPRLLPRAPVLPDTLPFSLLENADRVGLPKSTQSFLEVTLFACVEDSGVRKKVINRGNVNEMYDIWMF